MSGSSIERLWGYGRTRYPARISLPLALFLCAAALAGGGRPSPAGLAGAVGLAVALVFQFRLWDDLCDLERDRRDHPDRVLSRAASPAPFRALLVATLALNVALIAAGHDAARRLLVFAILNGALLVWYRWLRAGAGPVAGYHVVLGKYPAFVYLVSGDAPGPELLLAMALVYLCFCVYEGLHDPGLRAERAGLRALRLEMAALAATSALMTVALLGRGGPAVVAQAALTVAGALALASLFRRSRARPGAGRLAYGVFVIGFLQVLAFSLGGRS